MSIWDSTQQRTAGESSVHSVFLSSAHWAADQLWGQYSYSGLHGSLSWQPLLQYFETDDPDLFVSKITYVRDNDAEDLELVFAEEEYDDHGQVSKV